MSSAGEHPPARHRLVSVTELHDLSAQEQWQQLQRREIAPTELTEHYLARIERLDGGLGAFVTVTADDSVEECMRLMTEHRVRHLPVVEGANVVGIVSIGDLVNWIISTQSAAIEQMEQYIAGGVAA